MDAPGENGNSKLLNLGCSEDFVKKHNSEQLEVREFQSGDNLIASKVLLCGAQIDLPNLIVVAKTVILNDFFFLGGNESAIRVGAGTLILTGSNSIGKTTVNFDAAEEVNDSGISLVIQTALEGDGKLKLGSSFFTCKKKSEANETSAAARVSAE